MDFFAKGVRKLRVVCRAEFLQQILAPIAHFFCDVCVEQVHVALVAWCYSHCLAVFVVVGIVNNVLFVATTKLRFNGQVLFFKRQFDIDLFKFTHVAFVGKVFPIASASGVATISRLMGLCQRYKDVVCCSASRTFPNNQLR